MKANQLKKGLAALLLLATMPSWAGHVMLNGQLDSSRIYPGTTHEFQIYVPDQYDGHTPACLDVGLDGVLCGAPQVMDSLMSAGSMPVTIGVFLQPGVVRGNGGEVLRYNRSNEFDATDGRFAEFIEAELLPAISWISTPDDRQIFLSSKGSDHMIFGLSSGGIAAFTAAWHRPELFGRVFSGVGTFVAMRGGNDLQALVRKSEPKPLRIFLQDGSNDAWNPLFGHWYEGNRMLATALEFAGYDARFDWSDGAHNVKRSTEIFAQVMQWMWQGWPEPPTTGTTQNDLLSQLLIKDEDWQEMYDATPPHEAAPRMAQYPDGSLLVTHSPRDNRLWQYIVRGDSLDWGQPFYWLHSLNNALLSVGPMAFDAAGNLYVVTEWCIQICDQNGRVRGILELPQGVAPHNHWVIDIEDGAIVLRGLRTFSRRLRIKAPIPGMRPQSQGQG